MHEKARLLRDQRRIQVDDLFGLKLLAELKIQLLSRVCKACKERDLADQNRKS